MSETVAVWMAVHFWPQLPAELSCRIASCLHPNDVACTLRLVNKAAAAQFRGPQHTTIHLSQSVPEREFARHWGAPGATRHLPYKQRLQLLCLTAASGSIPNMEVALEAAGCFLVGKVLGAAAAAGQQKMCEHLIQRGCPCSGALDAAAEAGQREVCEWLLDNSHVAEWTSAVYAAARGGHVGLMEWMLATHPERCGMPAGLPPRALGWRRHGLILLASAAKGCDLATLQRLHQTWFEALPPQGPEHHITEAMLNLLAPGALTDGAASSPTPDWRDKVEWLEAQGHTVSTTACDGAIRAPDPVARLAWLRQRGCPVSARAVYLAACSGNLAVLQYLLAEGVSLRGTISAAAEQGHLHAVSWLVGALGPQARLDEDVMYRAAGSGSLEPLVWLRERGCPWSGRTFELAAVGGNTAMLEWLAEQGCPMQDDGQPYVQACRKNDPATLRCLARLGCPWGPDTYVFSGVVSREGATSPLLQHLLEAGCPVDRDLAKYVLSSELPETVRALLRRASAQ